VVAPVPHQKRQTFLNSDVERLTQAEANQFDDKVRERFSRICGFNRVSATAWV
jgi:hypothetical protein